MQVRVKNRTAHAVLLKNVDGDTIQLNSNVIKVIDDSFLIDYDAKAIQVFQTKTVTTSPGVDTTVTDNTVADNSDAVTEVASTTAVGKEGKDKSKK